MFAVSSTTTQFASAKAQFKQTKVCSSTQQRKDAHSRVVLVELLKKNFERGALFLVDTVFPNLGGDNHHHLPFLSEKKNIKSSFRSKGTRMRLI